jgi:hypothetical protein
LVITDAGEELIAKMVAGTTTATFTKVGISPRDYSGVQTEKLTDIEDVRQSTLVSNVVRTDGSKVEVLAAFENKDVTEGYYVRTVGIWAEDSDGNEILYAVATDSTPDYMPEYGGKTVSGISYRINIRVDRSSQVSVEVNPAATPTIEQVENIERIIETHTERGVTDNEGIHGLRYHGGNMQVIGEDGEWKDVTQDITEVTESVAKVQYDLTEVAFQLAVSDMIDSSALQNVIVDSIDSESSVQLASGSYASGKVYI